MHPLIGITTNRVANAKNPFHTVTLSESYLRAVQAAGGTPVLLPSIAPKETWDVLWERLDGFLFTGGDDVDPARDVRGGDGRCGLLHRRGRRRDGGGGRLRGERRGGEEGEGEQVSHAWSRSG